MRAMILAAGRGERMRPLTDTLPKPLLSVGGKPLIVHHIEKLAAAGVHEIVINYAWLGQKLVDALGDGRTMGVHIHWSPELQGGLETGGGIHHALPLLGIEPFLIVNGDTWVDTDYRTFTDYKLADDADVHLWLVDNPVQHPQGDFALQQGRVSVVADGDGQMLTYAGIAIYRPQLFADMVPGKFSVVPYLRQWMAAGRVAGTHLLADWRDIGTPERLQQLDQELSM